MLQQKRLERERLERLEKEKQEKLEREKQEKLEREKLKQERLKQEKLERERLEKLERERLEKERLKQEIEKNNRLIYNIEKSRSFDPYNIPRNRSINNLKKKNSKLETRIHELDKDNPVQVI